MSSVEATSNVEPSPTSTTTTTTVVVNQNDETIATSKASEADVEDEGQDVAQVANVKPPPVLVTVKSRKTENYGTYIDENNIRIPKRKTKVSRIFYAWAVKHNEPVDISVEPVCLTHFDPQSVARIFLMRKLREDKKATGRRDIYLQERGVNDIKTYGYVCTRRRGAEMKDVKFKGGDDQKVKNASFSIVSTQKKIYLNRKHLKEFRQQIMSRAGLSQDEIDAVMTEKETIRKDKSGNVIPESDMDSGEDLPANVTHDDLVDPEDDEEEKEKVAASIAN